MQTVPHYTAPEEAFREFLLTAPLSAVYESLCASLGGLDRLRHETLALEARVQHSFQLPPSYLTERQRLDQQRTQLIRHLLQSADLLTGRFPEVARAVAQVDGVLTRMVWGEVHRILVQRAYRERGATGVARRILISTVGRIELLGSLSAERLIQVASNRERFVAPLTVLLLLVASRCTHLGGRRREVRNAMRQMVGDVSEYSDLLIT